MHGHVSFISNCTHKLGSNYFLKQEFLSHIFTTQQDTLINLTKLITSSRRGHPIPTASEISSAEVTFLHGHQIQHFPEERKHLLALQTRTTQKSKSRPQLIWQFNSKNNIQQKIDWKVRTLKHLHCRSLVDKALCLINQGTRGNVFLLNDNQNGFLDRHVQYSPLAQVVKVVIQLVPVVRVVKQWLQVVRFVEVVIWYF